MIIIIIYNLLSEKILGGRGPEGSVGEPGLPGCDGVRGLPGPDGNPGEPEKSGSWGTGEERGTCHKYCATDGGFFLFEDGTRR